MIFTLEHGPPCVVTSAFTSAVAPAAIDAGPSTGANDTHCSGANVRVTSAAGPWPRFAIWMPSDDVVSAGTFGNNTSAPSGWRTFGIVRSGAPKSSVLARHSSFGMSQKYVVGHSLSALHGMPVTSSNKQPDAATMRMAGAAA